jgi:hypothetical protein
MSGTPTFAPCKLLRFSYGDLHAKLVPARKVEMRMRSKVGARRVLNQFLLFLSLLAICVLYISATACAQQSPKPVKVSEAEADKHASYRKMGDPMITALRLHGTVTLEFTITTEGTTTDIVPIAGDTKNALLVSRTKGMVSAWQYGIPYLVNSKPTPMRTTHTFTY